MPEQIEAGGAASRSDDPAFTRVVQLIAGDQPFPDWLPGALQRLAAGVYFARRQEEKRPGRAKMKGELFFHATALRRVRHSLGDPAILEHLDAAGGRTLDSNLVANVLQELADLYESAAANIRTAGGPDKASVGTPPSAKILCAIVISVVWGIVHGMAPSPGVPKVLQAAAAYWRAIGELGPKTSGSLRWGAISPEGWRKNFAASKGYPGDVKNVRQILTDGRRTGVGEWSIAGLELGTFCH